MIPLGRPKRVAGGRSCLWFVLLLSSISLALSSGCMTGAAAQGGIPPVLERPLLDQFGRPDSLGAYRGSVALVLLVTAKRLRQLKDWEADLGDRFPSLQILRVADVPDDRPPDEERIREKLRDRVPPEISILVDLGRDWARALDLDTSEPNLLIVTDQGVLAARYRGRHREDLADRVAVTLRELGLSEAAS